jgi:hypothetical protein
MSVVRLAGLRSIFTNSILSRSCHLFLPALFHPPSSKKHKKRRPNKDNRTIYISVAKEFSFFSSQKCSEKESLHVLSEQVAVGRVYFTTETEVFAAVHFW